jgi:hypothetical protein
VEARGRASAKEEDPCCHDSLKKITNEEKES